MSNYEYLLSDINKINGVGNKTAKLFKKKNINTVFDLLWSLPRDFIDRGDLRKINELQVGKIQTISIKVLKYNFPRIRNLPNRVICEDDTGKLECIFFNTIYIITYVCWISYLVSIFVKTYFTTYYYIRI